MRETLKTVGFMLKAGAIAVAIWFVTVITAWVFVGFMAAGLYVSFVFFARLMGVL